jgi:glycosyltransferase involved in cell wall biosynthesis
MKILWVKAGKLLPLDTGGKIRSYNILRHLAIHHEVTLLSYYGGRRDEAYEKEITQHFAGAVVVYTAAPDTTALERGIDYLRHLPSRAPYAVTKFTARSVRHLLSDWLSERRFGVAVCDFLSASLTFPSSVMTPTVLFQHNVESALWRRQADWEPNLLKRLAFKLEAFKMARYERATLARFRHVIAVSEVDRDTMKTLAPQSQFSVVLTGVDLQQYRSFRAHWPKGHLVMFTGSMDWEANIDAVDFFCRDVWPHIRARVPDAHFRIVGRDPHPRVQNLASDSVEVTGTVPSVMEHLSEASVVVVPLRIGGGTRLKIYQAMAMGKAVVSTTIGAEGLDVSDGRDVWLADEATSFADAVVALLLDEDLRRLYGKLAAELADQYDWSVIAERFAKVLDQVRQQEEEVPSAPLVARSFNA